MTAAPEVSAAIDALLIPEASRLVAEYYDDTRAYAFIVPLACLPAVAHTSKVRLLGYFAILFCGLGVFYSLFYLATPAVPRDALRPWGFTASS